MLNGDADRYEKACSLITKIVNHMTTHMQIGSPMAAAYLLGLPDHYCSHLFKPLYWRQYVRYILQQWPNTTESGTLDTAEENMVYIQKLEGQYIPMDTVKDYIYRPAELNNISLYNWVNQYEKVRTSSSLSNSEVTDRGSGDAEEQEDNSSNLENIAVTADILNTENINNIKGLDSITDMQYLFLAEHPHCDTHYVKKLPVLKQKVPNFLGGKLPKRDGPNTLYYSVTMLTLFKPWHTGKDLKLSNQTWQEAFNSHIFTTEQNNYMRYLNTRHECSDALDDFHSKRKHEYGNTFRDDHILQDIDQSWSGLEEDISINDQVNIDAAVEEYETPNTTMFKRWDGMLCTEIRLREAGWDLSNLQTDNSHFENLLSNENMSLTSHE